jgi:hypothetical protein
MQTRHFTEEQLEELAQAFGLNRVKNIQVRDGWASKDQLIWWRSVTGPEQCRASDPEHAENIKKFPDAYCVHKPTFKVVYS